MIANDCANVGCLCAHICDAADRITIGPCARILAETDGTGPAGTKREYIWLGDMPVAVIDKSVTPNKTLMVHVDHLNRPYFMTDSTKAVVFKAIYEPFGATYSVTGTASLNTLRFPGQWFQLESGLAYNWHRHYDATLGRYVSADPLGVNEGGNLFAYVKGMPFDLIDPEGLASKYQKPPNPNQRKGAEERKPTGERERNVAPTKPNDGQKKEEHSRRPKGGFRMRFFGPLIIDPCYLMPTLCDSRLEKQACLDVPDSKLNYSAR